MEPTEAVFERAIDVARDVCERHDVTLHAVKGRGRTRHVSNARKAVACALRMRTDLSIPEIGTFLNRDHTTICYLIGSAKKVA